MNGLFRQLSDVSFEQGIHLPKIRKAGTYLVTCLDWHEPDRRPRNHKLPCPETFASPDQVVHQPAE